MGRVADDALRDMYGMMSPCVLCPHRCGAKRAEGEKGRCGAGPLPAVASFGPHFGEEPELVGSGGSGTVFFYGCNLGCAFCQNHDISSRVPVPGTEPHRLAALMLHLEAAGCVNVNLVTPTHYLPPLAEAVSLARASGLSVPVVWNCGGYESARALALLDGRVEIFMPDLKSLDSSWCARFLDAPDYPEAVCEAVSLMYRMVGPAVVEGGVMRRGLLVRHLVMPGMLDDTARVLDFIAREAPGALVNVMGQYRPAFRAASHPELARRTTPAETARARRYAASLGLRLTR